MKNKIHAGKRKINYNGLTLGSFRSCVTSPKWIRLTAECLRWIRGFWTGTIPTTTYNHPHKNIINHTTKNTEYLRALFSLFYTTPMVLNHLFTETSCSKNMTEPKCATKYRNMIVHTEMSFNN